MADAGADQYTFHLEATGTILTNTIILNVLRYWDTLYDQMQQVSLQYTYNITIHNFTHTILTHQTNTPST